MPNYSRRHFLAGSSALLAGSAFLKPSLIPSAYGADTSGYKAMICIFLFGGMDQADTILPFDQTSYDQLAGIRPGLFDAYGVGAGNTSRDRGNLLELIPDNDGDFNGRRFALPPQMSAMRDMFDDGDMAIVGNVGPLLEPTDRNGFETQSVELPKRLFSHNDQQSTWTSLGVEGTQFGWGGKMADIVSSGGGNPLFTSMGLIGNDVFLSGEDIRPFLTSPYGYGRDVNIIQYEWFTGYGPGYDDMRERVNAFYGRRDFGHQNLLKMDYANISAQGIDNVREYNGALESASSFDGLFPETHLGAQLQTVAETISARGALGVNRQIFHTGMGGFDTHSEQTQYLPRLQTELSEAVSAFRNVMQSAGLWNDVTLFTASEFGRTTIDNGDGTDHGWGAHQFVMGGGVNGRRIYGDIPPPVLDTPQYTVEGGRLIPTLSVDSYAASLGRWFGLTDGEISSVFTNLSRFSETNIGMV